MTDDRTLIVPMLGNALVDACEKSQASPVEVIALPSAYVFRFSRIA
jgi:hypothetical protein